VEVRGNGNAYVIADSGQVILGDKDDNEPAAKGTTLKQYLTQNKAWQTQAQTAFQAHTHPETGAITGPTATPFPTPSDVPDIEASKVKVGG
jgi:hypothetical protein